ncbi:hypothetical protein HY623_03520 [Candidatus Uhrbacteria bacterium]|nr:hypothetical protein [Candidatus Uhrbacteria bacterium]
MNLRNSQLSSPSAQPELVRIRRFAQITIPTELKARFNLSEGDYLKAEGVKQGILFKPVSVINKERAWEEIFSSIKKVRPSSGVRKKTPQAQEESIATIIKAERKKIRR